VLSFDFLKKGARAYIAISGGIEVPVVLGSRSTYALGALGGHEGRKLQAGDQLPVGTISRSVKEAASVPAALRRGPGNAVELRMLPGLYWHRITDRAGKQFFEDTWKVAPEADRIGYRFKGGKPLEFVPRKQPFGAGSDPSNIVDACYPYGSIQVPGGTEPIVLHRDAVSGGGYFMVGTVISADMDLIGQLQPHTPTKFVKVDLKAALAARGQRCLEIDLHEPGRRVRLQLADQVHVGRDDGAQHEVAAAGDGVAVQHDRFGAARHLDRAVGIAGVDDVGRI
jgi:allophanate hydrolase subunit 2